MTGLKPHQVSPANELLRILRAESALDFSDTGTGKTYVACWCIKRLARPTLAVVPKIAQTSWHRAAAHFEDTISVVGYEALRTGRTPYGSWENNPPPGFRNETWLKCEVCQCAVVPDNPGRCPHNSRGIHCVETKKKKWNYGRFTFSAGIKQVVFDEVHRANAIKSLNAEMLMAARRQGIPTLMLSATAAASPLNMRAIGYAINLHSGVNFYQWTRRYGCGKIDGMAGWHWKVGADKRQACMEKLHREIFPEHGIRIRKEEIPGFPERTVEARLFDLDEHNKISKLYEQMRDATSALERRAELDKSPDLALTIRLRFLERIELLKVPIAVELAQDYLAKGKSVGIFVNFTSVINELSRLLKCQHIIDGASGRKLKRDQVIDEFQSNTARLVLLNSEAGGIAVSLQDLTGQCPRVGIVFAPQSARTFVQLCGRFQRAEGKSLSEYVVVLAAETPEEKIYEKLQLKLNNLEALNDGDMVI